MRELSLSRLIRMPVSISSFSDTIVEFLPTTCCFAADILTASSAFKMVKFAFIRGVNDRNESIICCVKSSSTVELVEIKFDFE